MGLVIVGELIVSEAKKPIITSQPGDAFYSLGGLSVR